jgi:hypothetical protein
MTEEFTNKKFMAKKLCEPTTKKGEEEDNIKYLERMLGALMVGLDLKGITVALRTCSDTTILTSLGSAPHLKVLDESEWEDYWGR